MTEPLVIHGDASLRYDFGTGHPLTPRRFGPGIELMRAVGATRIEPPRVATDDELLRLHSARYLEAVRAAGEDPWGMPGFGIGPGDCPPFEEMHEAAATVAGGSLLAMAAILGGEAEHAFHPGGGLHHAMRERASGFCIYNDVAFAVAAARDAGHRVLYVDTDVHHGDGTERLFWDDPMVLTVSIHESGRTLFPGTGAVHETGGPGAPGSAVNVPLLAGSSDASWLSALEQVVPALAASFQPTFLVTQHGADCHLFDPLAHLEVTTAGMARAFALLDGIAHQHAGGRWLATGGGGYDVYRVVPRSWSLVWLAQAHREVPERLPPEWRERWAAHARRHAQHPIPDTLLDPAGTAEPEEPRLTAANARTIDRALEAHAAARGSSTNG